MEHDLLNVQEVAAMLKVARNTVYELIKRGELGCFKVGKQLRVSRAEVEAYLQGTKPKWGAAPAPAPAVQSHASGASGLGSEELIRGSELIICGQDVSLDILATHIRTKYEGIPVYRSHHGSYNAVYALYQGKVNVATAHLWDGDTDTYNVTYIRKMMPGVPALVVRIGQRWAGLYVREGNPKGIYGWEDFRRADLVMANREKGSGVRVLIDEKFRLLGIAGETIPGYGSEHRTHLAVATQVAGGVADVGVGCEKGCQNLQGLAFIPLQKECYDLVIRKADADKPHFRALLEIVGSEAFKDDIRKAAGFDVSQTGQIIDC